MITSVFKKSTPINYSLVGILVIIFFFVFQFHHSLEFHSSFEIGKKIGVLVLLLVSFFLSNFIVKKNSLTKNSSYTILFFLLFLLLFPNILNSSKLLLANFFILLSIRRLISLQSLKSPKEKIFDASLWIFVASLFHFWCILFLALVYITIIFHVSRDYRNWLIPFIAFFIFAVIFLFYSLVIDQSILNNYLQSGVINLQIDYFTNKYQNSAFSIYAVFVVFFIFSAIFSVPNKPLNLQASYKKVIFATLFGIVIFVISANKTNELLVFTFLPMAIMATNMIEYLQNKMQQEIILLISIACSVFCFFSQL